MQKKEFQGRPYLRFAASQNYIKLKKVRQVVDIVASFAQETGIEPGALSIADVGCGYKAIYTLSLASLGYQVTGVDITDVYPEVKERAKGLEGVKFIVGDGPAFLKENRERFHIIMLLDVLEHLADPQGVVAAAAEALRAPGLLILVLPNTGSVGDRLWGRVLSLVKPYGEGPTSSYHSISSTLKMAEDYINQAGLEYPFAASVHSLWGPFPLLFLFGFNRPLAYLNLRLADHLPRSMVSSFVVCGQKPLSGSGRGSRV